MCGIAGVFRPGGGPADELRALTTRMARTIAHRGPDHEGVWTDGQVIGLANRRLAIVDLSPDGEQPMHTADGRYALVLNGEIYNFIELRADLEAAGHVFRGHADTEVLLAAIDRWGLDEAITRAAGMFAIALWDRETQTLTLVRDRAGKKPLYLATMDGTLYFASEIKAFRDGARLPLTRDDSALEDFLSLGYVPAPRTIYREISEVPPGGWLAIDARLERRAHHYWRLPRPSGVAVTAEEAIAETDRRLRLAVTQRLRADVPVGAFLSGGIDSGIMTAIAAQQSSTPVRTFTVVFAEGAFDEGPLAQQVADRYGTHHEVIRLAPDVETLLPTVVRAYDEPFGDPSALPTYAVSEAAARHVKVVLNGEGADECFAGYRRALAARYASGLAGWCEHVPGVSALMDRLPAPRTFRSAYAFAYRTARGLGRGPIDRYLVWSGDGFTDAEKAELLGAPASGGGTVARLQASLAALDGREVLDHFMAVDFCLSLADCLLVKIDIATMAHSLEGRSPFLDHRVVEWAASLPRPLLFDGTTTKPLLRRLAAQYLPPDLVHAPKRGFEIPLVDWVEGPLRPMIRDLVLSRSGLLASRCRRDVLERLLDGRAGLDRERSAKRQWLLLMLAAWDVWCRPQEPGA